MIAVPGITEIVLAKLNVVKKSPNLSPPNIREKKGNRKRRIPALRKTNPIILNIFRTTNRFILGLEY
jgi:hypothetical protein